MRLVVWVCQVKKKVDKQVFKLCFVILIYSGHALSYTSIKGTTSLFARSEKFSLMFFKFVVYNPCQSSPSLAILVPLWFIIIFLVFFSLIKLLFSRFEPFKGNFVCDQINSKYRD